MINNIYNKFCNFERNFAALILTAITLLVFSSAIMRTIGKPINWAVDISLLLFAWLVFLGGDIVVRETNLIRVDMFIKHFPETFQKGVSVIFHILMLGFLISLVVYGIPLCLDNKKRLFQATGISYSWCSLSVPVGAFLMSVSTLVRLCRLLKNEAAVKEV